MYALMIVDMQNDFVKRLSSSVISSLVDRQNTLLRFFERNGLPIFFVITEHRPDGLDALKKAREENDIPTIAGTAGARLVPNLSAPPSTSWIRKTKYSAFFETTADESLRGYRGSLVIAGVNTHACVRSTAIDACQRDIDVIIPEDCVASYDPEYHRESLRYLGSRVGRVGSSDKIMAEITQSLGGQCRE